ncbi:hypothetical protein K450DRAFT_248739 [Umbelopsis ramanniana AG]|uniref:Uncharacterized protein n=1 Tax=Umbelopsis ramanniana AG TaxID=1314678 RepID=A0AAD5E5W2_UMBRA|nr:uncharacterized protein K450DRAFT_248739 [Umbelopsis ramanniana AG]KAI8578038.1 hypothetical protein K450DRAFT_248739 [Umbelopsis ramanniana AG]
MCGVATQQEAAIVGVHHFVRRCTNNICRIIWNRDVNATRNMAFLGINWSTKWIAQILLSMLPFPIHQVCMSITSCKRPRSRRIENYN